MPTGRSRTYDNQVNISGTYHNIPLGTTVTSSRKSGFKGTCVDVIGNPKGVNSLDLSKQYMDTGGLDGQFFYLGSLNKEMNNFPLNWQVGSPDPRSVFPALSVLEKNNLSWSLLSKANPSTPEVSVPTFIGELKDIPSMMKGWYGLFAKPSFRGQKGLGDWATSRPWAELLSKAPQLIASGHLTWRWAIAPFIRDVRNMCMFQKAMAKRLRFLNDLCSGRRTIRRRVQLRKDAKITTTYKLVHSQGAFIYGWLRDSFTEEVWGTQVYSALDDSRISSIRFMDDKAKSDLAFRLTFGLTSYEALTTAWELMPWTWLIDWFTGFGTVLAATNNVLGLVLGNGAVMRHTNCETTLTIDQAASDTWCKLNKFYRTSYERKERFVASPVLPFAPTYLPLFERKAGLILGSLFILKVSSGNSLERNLNRLLVRK